jgi:hypothetical protein
LSVRTIHIDPADISGAAVFVADRPHRDRVPAYLLMFQILLPILAPLIDVYTIYGVLFLDPLPVLAYWLGFNLLMSALAILAFRLDREPLRALWLLPLQQLVYRQLMYLVVIQSAISAIRGVRLRWQHERSGELEAA